LTAPVICRLAGRKKKHDRDRRREKYLSRRHRNGFFESLPVKEFCVFAANYIWPKTLDDRRKNFVLTLASRAGATVQRRNFARISTRVTIA